MSAGNLGLDNLPPADIVSSAYFVEERFQFKEFIIGRLIDFLR